MKNQVNNCDPVSSVFIKIDSDKYPNRHSIKNYVFQCKDCGEEWGSTHRYPDNTFNHKLNLELAGLLSALVDTRTMFTTKGVIKYLIDLGFEFNIGHMQSEINEIMGTYDYIKDPAYTGTEVYVGLDVKIIVYHHPKQDPTKMQPFFIDPEKIKHYEENPMDYNF